MASTAARTGIAVPVDPVAAALAQVVSSNRRRAMAVLALPAVVVLVVAVVIGAVASALVVGVVAGVVLSIAAALGLWRGAADVVLRALRARAVEEDDVPGAFTQVEGLCATMGLPLPALYLVDDELPDALAVGRGPDDGRILLTTGLLSSLDPVALEGVLAHELAHLKRHDTTPATVGAALALLVGVGGGSGGRAVHRVAGRGREFEADRHAVGVTRYPPGLSQALASMRSASEGAGAASAMALSRAGQLSRWLFTVALPDRARWASGHVPDTEETVGELDAPAVRIAALDEW